MFQDEPTEFWICNISDKNVTLSDLRISVPSRKGLNLLDKKHYNFSYEDLKESMTSGSIFNKRDKIKVGNGPPQKREDVQKTICQYPIVTRKRSAVKIVEPHFEEFVMSDEEYAAEMARDLDEDFE